ncbi:ABC transporter permease subunit [Paenibacillus sp. P26]|nr:ABC transporter permease subunit [Paenibacillus sp. P26]
MCRISWPGASADRSSSSCSFSSSGSRRRSWTNRRRWTARSWFGIYWRIILPLTKPALVTVAIYCFLWNWDDFFGHLLYINSVDKYTVGLALKMFVDSQSALPWGQSLAMALVSVVPSLIIFFMAQRHFVDGIASGAVKG